MGDVIQLQLEIHIVNFIAALVVLIGFGIAYNHWVADLEKRGHDRGYMGFIVALGCTVTILAGFLWPTGNLLATSIIFAAFFCSGMPMIAGSISRHNKKRDERKADERANKTRDDILAEDNHLTPGQQVLLEHIAKGLIEGVEGLRLAALGATQMIDPIYARKDGRLVGGLGSISEDEREKEEEFADKLMKGLWKLAKKEI